MFLPDLVVRSHRVVTPRGTRPAAIHVRGGRIIGVLDFDDMAAGCPVEDMDPAFVLPGFVDTRVHVDACATGELDFAATTRAAAAGGITTIVVAPSGECPVTSVSALESRRACAREHSWADVGFRAAVIPGNASEIQPLAEAGVFGFECALVPGGELKPIGASDAATVWPGLRHIGATLMVQAETAEDDGVSRLVELCRQYQTATHIVHLSSSSGLTPLFHGRAARLPITAETCPHYLNLVAEELAEVMARALGPAPPVRGRENREFLWAALAHGLLQMVVADRFTALESSVPQMWTAAHTRGYAEDRLAEWMAAAPARLAGLARKGAIEVGYDADLAVVRAEPTPVVERTYLRGSRIYSRADGWALEPPGRLLLRGLS